MEKQSVSANSDHDSEKELLRASPAEDEQSKDEQVDERDDRDPGRR